MATSKFFLEWAFALYFISNSATYDSSGVAFLKDEVLAHASFIALKNVDSMALCRIP
ncbi:MAG: hypothetical protein Phog2KO_50650 [Phototrophicaceae bacterium]